MSHFEAMTTPWAIYFKDSTVDVDILAHEMVHVAQIDEAGGWFKFYLSYNWEWFKGLIKYRSFFKAYWNNKYEQDARNRAHTFK